MSRFFCCFRIPCIKSFFPEMSRSGKEAKQDQQRVFCLKVNCLGIIGLRLGFEQLPCLARLRYRLKRLFEQRSNMIHDVKTIASGMVFLSCFLVECSCFPSTVCSFVSSLSFLPESTPPCHLVFFCWIPGTGMIHFFVPSGQAKAERRLLLPLSFSMQMLHSCVTLFSTME